MVMQQIHEFYTETGYVPIYAEFRVLPDNVIYRAQQGAEGKWLVYCNDQRPTGEIKMLATYDEPDYNEALFAAMGAAEAYCETSQQARARGGRTCRRQ